MFSAEKWEGREGSEVKRKLERKQNEGRGEEKGIKSEKKECREG